MQAVERLRGGGYKVDRILSLIDREQGGAEFYRSVGLDFEAVFTIKELLEWMAAKK
jgi:orotate phosphoribosyltransferase